MWPPLLNDPNNRQRGIVLLGIASVIIVIVLVGSLLIWDYGNREKPTATGETVVTVNGAFDPNNPAYANLPELSLTTTSTTSTTEPETTTTINPNRGAEGVYESAQDLAISCNVSNSKLQPSVWDQANGIATDLLKARTMGVNKDRFADFISKNSPIWQMSSLNVIYVCSRVSPDAPEYVQTTIYWGGTKSIGGNIKEAATRVYLAPGTLAPVPDKELSSKLKADPYVKTRLYDNFDL
jgi:hypothetical protein